MQEIPQNVNVVEFAFKLLENHSANKCHTAAINEEQIGKPSMSPEYIGKCFNSNNPVRNRFGKF